MAENLAGKSLALYNKKFARCLVLDFVYFRKMHKNARQVTQKDLERWLCPSSQHSGSRGGRTVCHEFEAGVGYIVSSKAA